MVMTVVRTAQEFVARLAAQPAVAGIVRYGSRGVDAAVAAGEGLDPAGDLDLFVLVDERPSELESIHFYLGEVPVDLSVRTWDDVERAARREPLTAIDYTIAGGEILYDRDGTLAARLRALAVRLAGLLPPLSEHDIASIRFGQRHSLDKVRGRLTSDPVLCRVLLESNVYWLLQHYFLVRWRRFPGEKGALRELAEREPALWCDIVRFDTVADLHERVALAESLNERVLAPIGGLGDTGTSCADEPPPPVRRDTRSIDRGVGPPDVAGWVDVRRETGDGGTGARCWTATPPVRTRSVPHRHQEPTRTMRGGQPCAPGR